MVDNERSIFRNTAFSVAGRGAGDLCTFLFMIVFARSFGSEALGEFSFAMAIGALIAVLVVPGISTILVRETARLPAEGPRFVGAVASLQLIVAALLFALLLVIGGSLVDTERGWRILLIISSYQLIYTLAWVFRHYFRALEQTQFSAALEVGHKIMILLGGLAILMLVQTAEMVLLVYPLAAIGMYIAGYALLAHRHHAPRLHFDMELSQRWFLASLPLFATAVLGVIQTRAGFIYLGSVGDSVAVGQYAAGDRLIAAASLFFLMFNAAVFPVMSRMTSIAELNQLLARCQRIAVTLAVPLAALVILLREPIVELFFGPDFAASADVLAVLAPGMAASAISGPANALMIVRNQMSAILWIQLLGVFVFFVAMAVLVPEHGFIGLAWAVLLLKLVSCVTTLAYLEFKGYAVPHWEILRAPLVAAAGMAAAWALAEPLTVILQAASTLFVGAILLVAFGAVRKHDVDYMRRILGLGT
jgi:O-antigen/teichoic acid export membrane protein